MAAAVLQLPLCQRSSASTSAAEHSMYNSASLTPHGISGSFSRTLLGLSASSFVDSSTLSCTIDMKLPPRIKTNYRSSTTAAVSASMASCATQLVDGSAAVDANTASTSLPSSAECDHYYSVTAPYGGLDDVEHLTDWLPHLSPHLSPLIDGLDQNNSSYFVDPEELVASTAIHKLNHIIRVHGSSSAAAGLDGVMSGQTSYFRSAGPREKVYYRAEEARACIVTCGGLCPGLNTVIRELVCCLWNDYGVRDIVGIHGGYRGFYACNTLPLNPRLVDDIHRRGGSILGASRGGHHTAKIVDGIQDRGINQVYVVGGDGTQKGAALIHEEIKRRGLKVSVACIPKTIDNDIDVIDKTFGFDSAVEEAQRAISAAHVEAESVHKGVGLVKLMGRHSGLIAMHATLASRDVDCCLIPEVPFYLEGEGGLYEFLHQRLRANGHAVIVVAEGAGQDLMIAEQEEQEEGARERLYDASGNRRLLDVGPWLSRKLKDHFDLEAETLNLKYIDPTYMIRAIPSNAADNIYCTLLAQSAAHGAMAGYAGFTVGPVNGRHAYIPIRRVTQSPKRVRVTDRMWARLLSSTKQPAFCSRRRHIMLDRQMHSNSAEQHYNEYTVPGDAAATTKEQLEDTFMQINTRHPVQV